MTTYSTTLNNEDLYEESLLAIVAPRRRITHDSFALYSGSVYRSEFSYGYINLITIDGTDMASGSSTSLSAGQFYYDNDAQYIYLRKSDSSAPASGEYIISTYELYFGTQDFQWHRDPLDETSEMVNWDPFILSLPSAKETIQDSFAGYLPTQVSPLILSNNENVLESHLYDSSFIKAEIKGYHYLGQPQDINASGTKLIFKGFVDSISYSGGELTLGITDQTDIFRDEFRSSVAGVEDYMDSSSFTSLDPNFEKSSKRRGFGFIQGNEGIQGNYVENSELATDNNEVITFRSEDFVNTATNGHKGTINIQSSIASGSTGSGTVTTIYFTPTNFTDLFQVGHHLLVHPSGTVFSANPMADYATYRSEITTVGSNYVVINPGRNVLSVHNHVRMGQVPRIDYFTTGHPSGNFTITNMFKSYYMDFKGGMGVAQLDSTYVNEDFFTRTLQAGDRILFDFVGNTFQSNENAARKCTTNGYSLLKEIFINEIGIPAADLDDSFDTLEAASTTEMAFSTPLLVNDKYESYKDVITRMILSLGAYLYRTDDNKWAISEIEQIGTPSEDISDDDIRIASFSFEHDYLDVTNEIIVEYYRREIRPLAGVPTEGVFRVSSTSDIATYLHKVVNTKTFLTYIRDETSATNLAQVLRNFFSERRGIYKLEVAKKFLDTPVTTGLNIVRTKLPGFEFDENTERTRKVRVIEVNKNQNRIILTLEDQKGVEDN